MRNHNFKETYIWRKDSSANFFTYSLNSISQIEIQLFDNNKQPLSKVVINENVIDKSVVYKISTSDTDVEWVKVTRSGDKNKDITKAISSSGKNLEIVTLTEENEGECKAKKPISNIEIFSDNSLLKNFSKAELQTKESRESIKYDVLEAEATIYDTYKLELLQKVILSLDNLHRTVLKNSFSKTKATVKNINFRPPTKRSNIIACDVYCVRIGTLIPVFLCTDNNCRTGCGVDGVYLLSGFGCNIICSIPCTEFGSEVWS